MDPAERLKLVKILRMLSSSFANERDNAALAAHEFVRHRNLDWDDIIASPDSNDKDEDEYEDDDEYEGTTMQRIDRCLATFASHPDATNDWEREFLHSIKTALSRWDQLTARQQACLDRIHARLKAQGLTP